MITTLNIIEKLRDRMQMNETTAKVHPEAGARHDGEIRAKAYANALNDAALDDQLICLFELANEVERLYNKNLLERTGFMKLRRFVEQGERLQRSAARKTRR